MKKYKIHILFLFFLLFSTAGYYFCSLSKIKPDFQKETKNFKKTLHIKEKIISALMDSVIKEIKTDTATTSFKNAKLYEDIFSEEEIAVIVSKKNSVIYWSTNSVPVEDIIVDTLYISEIFHLNNGWYEVREKRFDDFLVRGAILIKREYKYQNDYLKTEFQKDFKIPANTEIQLVEGEYNINSMEDYLLCSLIYKKTKIFSQGISYLSFTCFILAYIFFISFLIGFTKKISYKFPIKWVRIFVISFIILFTRFLSFKYRFPGLLYSLEAFGPKYYADSYLLPSLGDLFLNVITLFLIIVFIFRNYRRNILIKFKINTILQFAFSLIIFYSLTALFFVAENIIKGLILNSSLIFDLNNIFSLDFYSIVGLFIVGFIFVSYFLISYIFIEIAYVICGEKLKKYFTALAISIIIYISVQLFYSEIEWLYITAITILFIATGIYLKRDKKIFTLQAIAFYIVIFSFISTYCFYINNTNKEKEKRKLLASQLSIDQDPIAEYLFDNVEKDIQRDTSIQNIINSDSEEKEVRITDILKDKYLNGFWSRYNFIVIVCQPGQVLNVKPDNITTDCDIFFHRMIANTGFATLNPNLFFINDGTGRNNYLAKIPFFNSATDTIPSSNLYLELDTKFIDRELGYPELLIDKKIKINKGLYNYSYAKYRNNQLLIQYGKFYYSLKNGKNKTPKGEYTFFEKDGYDHLLYNIDENSSLIISKKEDSLLYIIAPFSYIFIFNSFFILGFLLVLNFPMKKREINMNFKTRIQISMFSVLIVSFVTIGLVTMYYINNLYDKKNVDNISEKAHSVLIEIENKLGCVKRITPEMKDDIADIMTKLSNVFFTDINFYTQGGMLVASSRPQVFDEGMISRKMDTKAFRELSVNKKTLYIHEENIGKLNYISVYVPFRNNENELAGYINLPYFAKQSELKKEISTFLIAFININVILIALAIIIALLVSNYITRPMKLIKEKIGHIKLGKKNEKIEWSRNDEIGALISEYNRMIEELSESAELLAKSERESAWREMAKQVAHEIKNPLTPMKLSIQFLQKSWKEKPEDWDNRLDKFSHTMTEQIDSLSRIASEFSDFAKMPKARNEDIDLTELIGSTVVLFDDNRKSIRFAKPESGKYIIFADKTLMLRVFNNLIKNAIQAIAGIENGMVEIKIQNTEESVIISISDNGTGISEQQQEKIFSPNFTTKTGGMGLGLAMVKNIVESYNGKICFESIKGGNTTFFVELPFGKD